MALYTVQYLHIGKHGIATTKAGLGFLFFLPSFIFEYVIVRGFGFRCCSLLLSFIRFSDFLGLYLAGVFFCFLHSIVLVLFYYVKYFYSIRFLFRDPNTTSLLFLLHIFV